MQLPFLKAKKWPRVAAPMEEKSYAEGGEIGREPDELIHGVVHEFMDSIEKRDPKGMIMAFRAIMSHIQSEEHPDASV